MEKLKDKQPLPFQHDETIETKKKELLGNLASDQYA